MKNKPMRPPFVDAMFDDAEWRAHVQNVGLAGAMVELQTLKSELKIQRRERAGTPGYSDFVREQAKFEAKAVQRMGEVMRTMTAGRKIDESKGRLKQRMTEYVGLIGELAEAIEGTTLHVLLHDYKIKFRDEEMTLFEALKDGRFERF